MTEDYQSYSEADHFYERADVATWLAGLPVFESERRLLGQLRADGAVALTDIGSGSGRLAAEALDLGYRYRGVDVSPVQIGALRERHPEVETHIADATNLPFDNGTADVALLCFHVIEAIMPESNRVAAIIEARRILRPHGFLVLSHHRRLFYRPWQQIGHWFSGHKDGREFGDLILYGSPRTGGIDLRGLPMHIPSASELRRHARHAGFRQVSATPLSDAPTVLSRWTAGSVLEKWQAI